MAEWMEGGQGKGHQDKSQQGTFGREVGPEEWRRLEDVMCRRFGVFLSGPGASGETDVEGALWRAAKHLLGVAPETAKSWVPIGL